MTENDVERVADRYLYAADASLLARTKRAEQQARYESRGLLLALEIMLGLDTACHLIASRPMPHNGNADKLLYDFWKLGPR